MRCALLVCVLVTGCAKIDPRDNAAPVADVAEKGEVAGLVDLQVLAQDYLANEVAADGKYLRRRVTCEGFMHRLEKLESGGLMMSFEYFVDGFNLRQGIVYAYFPASAAPSLAKYEYRDPVYFSGRCDGLEKKSVRPFIAIRDCRIVAKPQK